MKSSMFSHYITQLLFYFQCFVFAIVCVFSLNTVSGDTSSDVSCDGDSGHGICQYEGYWWEETCEGRDKVTCITYIDMETRQVTVHCSFSSERTCKVIGTRYTFWIQGETGLERMNRIIQTVDDHVVQGVERLKVQCALEDGEGNPIDLDEEETSFQWLCRRAELAYEGLTTPPNGDYLRELENRYLVLWGKQNNVNVSANTIGIMNKIKNLWGGKRRGNIYLDIGNLERLYSNEEWNEQTVEVIAHERVHLADWMDNGIDDWIGNPHGPGDTVYKLGEHLRNFLGPSGVEWSRTCPEPEGYLWKLPGWGHDFTDPNYCRIGEIREVLRN